MMTDAEIIEAMREHKYEMEQDMIKEALLRRDFDAFYAFTKPVRNEAVDALNALKTLYKLFGWEFDINTIMEEVC